MKRKGYVDSLGNPINHNFESKKPILYVCFLIGTIFPLVLIGFIIYTVIQNSGCDKVYDEVKLATLNYLKEEEKLPSIEGESVIVSVGKLYNEKYLSSFKTKNMTCSGNVKTTKYKNDYVYTLSLTNCNTCTTNSAGDWSGEISYYPTNKSIVDVVPYYNYYERQVVSTDWTRYFEQEQLSDKKSKYGVNLPLDENELPEVPEEGNIVEIQKEEVYHYRYKDKEWKWYDITGNYSAFSSEQPEGFSNKDESTKIYTNWSEYSLNYPEEKSYREITQTVGYQFYYEKDGKKIYANNKNYVAVDDVDQTKYDRRENSSVKMYHYRDAKWRWYNGQKRRYSSYSSIKPSGYNYRDDDTLYETSYSSWDDKSRVTSSNAAYRVEEKKVMTKFRCVYEILSNPIFEKPVTKSVFVESVGMSVPEFAALDNYKIEVSYKFKYLKR